MSQTPSQTVGPFFHNALPWAGGHDVAGAADGAIEIFGQVRDGQGAPVPDALIETWQADPSGRYAEPGADFIGFGRAPTDAEGFYRFRTVRPGPVLGPGNSLQAPHIAIGVFARGLLKRLVTRLYFADSEGLDSDPILGLVPEDRRHTLVARGDGYAWRLDIVLQGEHETVFFDI